MFAEIDLSVLPTRYFATHKDLTVDLACAIV